MATCGVQKQHAAAIWLKSESKRRRTSGYWTLTTTALPLSSRVARCTCPIEAGLGLGLGLGLGVGVGLGVGLGLGVGMHLPDGGRSYRRRIEPCEDLVHLLA